MNTLEEIKLQAEEIDRLMTTNITSKYQFNEKYPIVPLMYQAARERSGGDPLTYTVAKKLIDTIEPGDTVFLTSGFIFYKWRLPETDGPPGVAALARAFDIGLDARVIVLTDPGLEKMHIDTIKITGLHYWEGEEEVLKQNRRFTVLTLPIDREEAKKESIRLLDKFKPKVFFSIEKPGENVKGVMHSRVGVDINFLHGKFDEMAKAAKERGIITVGIGDGGNELGMGGIRDVVEKYTSTGAKCQCPCKSGVASATELDYVIPTSISNWGAYGVEACMALLLDNVEVMHDGEMEHRVLTKNAESGALSGPGGYCVPMVDSLPSKYNSMFVDFLKYIVDSRIIVTKTFKDYHAGKHAR
ncbi:MAG: hypothetical protein DRP87_17015 [Spirochaetes bacterium]|nr:MAG: hypothetical protein DRP87_17015 [Spirochaetota bacterium]